MPQRFSFRHVAAPDGERDYYQVFDLTTNKPVGRKHRYNSELNRAVAFNAAKLDAKEREQKKPTLSEFQQRAVETIKAHGGSAKRTGGGYWAGADGTRLEVEPVGDSVHSAIGTTTIRALAKHGVMKRANEAKEEWRDSYVLVGEQP